MEECSNNNGSSKRKNYHPPYYYCSNKISKNNDEEDIRKGPWKPEEDQVLLTHVRKYGPRDWSSIRSKGLLQRTGKSCRLRWVNKLRPNLKIGCKFTAEEEKLVIEMQAQIGNKWATIAKNLPGRTDNDVKNFWSSRQKRLGRILHSQSPPHKKQKSTSASVTITPRDHPHHFLEVPNKFSMEGETSSRPQSLNSSSQSITTTDSNTQTSVPSADQHVCPTFQPNNTTYIEPIPSIMYCNTTDLFPFQDLPFPLIPSLETDLSPFPLETQELIERLDSSFLMPPFGCTTFDPPLLDDWTHIGEASGVLKRESDDKYIPETPDSFSDELPSDIFDQLEPLPSP